MEAYIILSNSDDRIETINTESIEKSSIKSVGTIMQCAITLHLERIDFTADVDTARKIEHAICMGYISTNSNKEYKVDFN